NGLGFSVQQVIDTARSVTGRQINTLDAPRRAGDPPRLVADASKAIDVLGWRPEFASLEEIVRHAWEWELQYPWSKCQG
ncbi:UDP-glucose 4-epimerase GalE, partial [Pseudomonas sp. CrR7]|nr:UDP-glucose 4-epimerase GalE [Pseudomonas sp. CM27]